MISTRLIRVAVFSWRCNSGIQTLSRVRCWQAKIRRSPGRSSNGQWNTLNAASPSPPPGNSTGRLNSTGPIAVTPMSRSAATPCAASPVVKATRSMPSPRRRRKARPGAFSGVSRRMPSSST